MTKAIAFSKSRFLFMGLSAVLIIAMFVLGNTQGGFNLGVEFSPGFNVRIQVADSSVQESDIDAALEAAGYSDKYSTAVQPQISGEVQYFVIQVKLDEDQASEQSTAEGFETLQKRELDNALGAAFGRDGYTELEFNNTSPSQVADLSTQMIWIVAAALLLILVYITIRFRWQYALGAIAAIAHDVLFLLAFLMVAQVEFSSATVAALLTIIGYSLNDTIVIFDRIRENRGLNPDLPLLQVSDLSITQSLSRTVITSVTTFLAVSAILFLAFGSIWDFALALTVGIVVGTYSSIFVASPVMSLFSPSKEAAKPKLSVS
jgi:preprotein translocase subunit SecF